MASASLQAVLGPEHGLAAGISRGRLTGSQAMLTVGAEPLELSAGLLAGGRKHRQ